MIKAYENVIKGEAIILSLLGFDCEPSHVTILLKQPATYILSNLDRKNHS